jgi:hypothetical protein
MFYIHVNKNKIASNRKHGKAEPAVRFQKGKYGKPVYANRVAFETGEIVYKPSGEPLLPCGARLVIQTETRPTVLE